MNTTMKYVHDQCGYGLLTTYQGIPYQQGYGGAYQGAVFQRGYGLGGVLGNFYRAVVRPAFKAGVSKLKKDGLPALKRVGKAAAKRAAQKALQAGMDVALTQRDIKEAIKTSVKDVAKSTTKDALKEVSDLFPHISHWQSGRGKTAATGKKSGPRKRKRDTTSNSTSKRGRLSIFD
jgi:hypothetical protein